MRIAVLSGLLACTLIFAGSSQSASASESDLIAVTPRSTESVSLKLVAAADTTKSELLPLDKEATENEEINIKQETKHVIQKNETLSDVAQQYNTTWQRLFDKNETIENPDIVNPGETVVVPAEDEKIAARELPQAPVVLAEAVPSRNTRNRASTATIQTTVATTTTSTAAPRGSSSGNLYTAGNCTWYVKSLRPDLPNNLGNANTWASRAAAQGFATGSEPRVGAAAQFRGRMHVAYVTGVNGDGTVNITDMNYRGLYQVTNRTVPANSLIYIY